MVKRSLTLDPALLTTQATQPPVTTTQTSIAAAAYALHLRPSSCITASGPLSHRACHPQPDYILQRSVWLRQVHCCSSASRGCLPYARTVYLAAHAMLLPGCPHAAAAACPLAAASTCSCCLLRRPALRPVPSAPRLLLALRPAVPHLITAHTPQQLAPALLHLSPRLATLVAAAAEQPAAPTRRLAHLPRRSLLDR
jgi:hypothetical protein